MICHRPRRKTSTCTNLFQSISASSQHLQVDLFITMLPEIFGEKLLLDVMLFCDQESVQSLKKMGNLSYRKRVENIVKLLLTQAFKVEDKSSSVKSFSPAICRKTKPAIWLRLQNLPCKVAVISWRFLERFFAGK